jgi:hypothetical protein
MLLWFVFLGLLFAVWCAITARYMHVFVHHLEAERSQEQEKERVTTMQGIKLMPPPEPPEPPANAPSVKICVACWKSDYTTDTLCSYDGALLQPAEHLQLAFEAGLLAKAIEDGSPVFTDEERSRLFWIALRGNRELVQLRSTQWEGGETA